MEVEQPNGSFQEGDVSWQQGGILGMKLKMPAFPHCRRRILLFGTTKTKGNSADISDIFFFRARSTLGKAWFDSCRHESFAINPEIQYPAQKKCFARV